MASILLLLFVGTLGTASAQEAAHETATPGEHAAADAEHSSKHSAEHAEEAPMPNEIWWKWANFALLAAGLGYVIAKNAPGFFQSRTAQIQEGIASATRTREDAEARAAAIELRVSNLSAEIEQLRTQSREELARESARVREETETSLRKIQTQSRTEIAAAIKHAGHDLKAYSAQLAIEMAERQIRERMSQGTQDQLTSAFVEDVRSRAVRN